MVHPSLPESVLNFDRLGAAALVFVAEQVQSSVDQTWFAAENRGLVLKRLHFDDGGETAPVDQHEGLSGGSNSRYLA